MQRVPPDVTQMPAILHFLGYDPAQTEGSFGKQLRATRRALGLTQKPAGKIIGRDRSSRGMGKRTTCANPDQSRGKRSENLQSTRRHVS